MYKLVVFATLLAVAAAAPGLIGAPIASPIAAGWGHAPIVSAGYVSPVVKTAVPVATSYANTVRIASPVVAAPAYGVAAPAYGVAAPAYGVAAPAYGVAAPAYGVAAHAPLVAAHGW